MSFTVERVTQVVLGAKQELDKATLSRTLDEWKGVMLVKELDNLSAILRLLAICTDPTTTQAILKQIFVRAKEIWAAFKDQQKGKISASGSSAILASSSGVRLREDFEGEKEGEKETAEERRKREAAERKEKEEKEWRERTEKIKKEREERERERAREQEERETRERLERLEREKQREKEREAARERERERIEREEKAKRETKQKKEKKKTKKTKKGEAAKLPKQDKSVPTTVLVAEDLGLTNSPTKDKKHQEWDAEIVKLNNVVNEKIRNLEIRRSRRNLAAGSVMIPNPRTTPTSAERIFQSQSAPKATLSHTSAQPASPASQPATTAPKSSAGTSNRIAATASIFEKTATTSARAGNERARPQTMLIRPSADSRPSASSLADKMESGNQSKVTEAIQKAGREATAAAQLLLQKEGTDNAALNSAIRMMVINFKAGTEYLTNPSQKKLKDDILDVCMAVLLKTKEYLADPNQTKKGLLVKEVARALTIIKDYNQS